MMTSVQLCLALIQSELKTPTTNPRGGTLEARTQGESCNCFRKRPQPSQRKLVGGSHEGTLRNFEQCPRRVSVFGHLLS